MPNINNIDIDDYHDFVNPSMDVDEPFAPIDEGYDFFPLPQSYPWIRFDMYIPYRVQSQLSPLDTKLLTHTERFRIYILSFYEFPMTFVEAIEPSGDCEASGGVVIIREFLKKHFEESESDYIRFDCLGPSPFHADFFLQPAVTSEQDFDNSRFHCEPLYQTGYDRMDFFFDPSLYENLNHAKDRLFQELGREIGVFCSTVHHNLMKMHSWGRLQHLVSALVKAHKVRGLRALWNTLFKVPKQIRELTIAVAEFESHELMADYEIQRNYRGLIHDRKEPFIDSHIKAEMQDVPVYKCTQIRDLVELLETRRGKTTEGIITIFAAILGGVIGAAITLLATVW